ncbi:uncharacterized protein [Physcomitrium patens]|uniref:Glucose-methanol-choline oxidoreductase C-terminal domain-containing protein n=1 Tax=Physcomitrium patens TaxID=3218 RepID=A9RD44_PHYPA|nr:uncharacterized protein LOC112284991 [Physcomitrium patens]PNR51417.1 hypothetical protein PHYPA_010604 [Physcomitrium patens]|eukprot:XP_024381185.1 uncharacterized protein LOC112284991 [Physcomitrella patens]
MSGFTETTYNNLITQQSETQQRLFAEYTGNGQDFDIVIVGSGIGGGILADDIADNSNRLRILVIEAGSYLFPTHVYNVSRFPNASVASKYGVQNFTQTGDDNTQYYIGEQPQLNLGGRSIFWSGLIPSVQPWELQFFPPNVRSRLSADLKEAQNKLNVSVTMGNTAQNIVKALQQSPLAEHFDIRETPRALHQPYLTPSGAPAKEFFLEPTGVFNTAELLINQIGLKPQDPNAANQNRLQLLLNHYVESVEKRGDGRCTLQVKDIIGKRIRQFTARAVVLAAGSLESPKIIRRSPVFNSLSQAIKDIVGQGLTDHPTTNWIQGNVTHIGNTEIPRNGHAKIVFYSRGLREAGPGSPIRYPFNIEMNVNHEYWHLRENDPTSPEVSVGIKESVVEIKFSFGNLLDDENTLNLSSGTTYVPQIQFKNLKWMDDLSQNRFRNLAGWRKTNPEIFAVLNDLVYKIFSQFRKDGAPASPVGYLGQDGRGFGYGTVHHSVGTLRMPATNRLDSGDFSAPSVVDEDLMVRGHPGLYVCDMSVLPYSSSANPVLSLAALTLQLSRHLRNTL